MHPKLYRAATSGDVGFLEQVANATADTQLLLLSKAPQQNTALHIAASFGHAHFTRKLLQLCRTQLPRMTNSNYDTALHCAAKAGCLEILQILLDFESMTSMEKADDDVEEEGGSSSSVGLLRMQNKEGDTALHQALRTRSGEMAIKMVKADPKLPFVLNDVKESSFLVAVKEGMEDVVREILFGNLSANTRDVLAAALAVKLELEEVEKQILLGDRSANWGDMEAVAIKSSSDLMAETRELIQIQDTSGRTALHYAAWRNNDKIIYMILTIDSLHVPYIVDENGHSPLHMAVAFGMQRSVFELLKHCPDTIEQLDTSSRNILHIAFINRTYEIVQELLKLPHIEGFLDRPDKDGNTPFHLASRDNALASLLRNRREDLITVIKDGEIDLGLGSVFRDQSQHMPDVIPIKEIDTTKELDTTEECELKLIDTMKEQHQVFVVVASLIAAVTFAAAFSLPGGYRSSNESNRGAAVLANKPAFKAFLLLDTLAMCVSIFAIVCYIVAWGARVRKDKRLVFILLPVGNCLTLIGCICMLFTLSAGMLLVVGPESMWLAITVSIICSILPTFFLAGALFYLVSLLW